MKIHVATSKGRSRIKGFSSRGVEVDIAAPAVEGRANDEVLALLRKVFGARSSQIEITSGHHSRDKVIQLSGLNKEQVERTLINPIER